MKGFAVFLGFVGFFLFHLMSFYIAMEKNLKLL